jgi:hypothetical protein
MSMEIPKILIISQGAWDNSTSFGNTFTNFFNDWDSTKIAHIYTDSNHPDTKCCERFFNISEKCVFQSIFVRGKKTGYRIQKTGEMNSESFLYNSTEINKIDYIKSHLRLQIFFWIRELLWCFGKWQSLELNKFLDEFKPDIIFTTFSNTFYINRIQKYIIRYCSKPVVMYTADDGYTLKQFSLSLFYWIDRIIKQRIIQDTVSLVDVLYVISQKQLDEYNTIFGQKCRLLYKWADFSKEKKYEPNANNVVKLVYTGNINLNRWKSLVQIGKAIDKLNRNKKIAEIDVYSMTPYTRKIKNAFDKIAAINFKGGVSHNEVLSIQNNADILIHCEALSFKERLKVRLSFSTKIVDYLSRKRCIFAVGNKNCASISYLIENDAAVVATTRKEIEDKLNKLIHNKKLIIEYSEKAWRCGNVNHNMEMNKNIFYYDLMKLNSK